MIQWTTPTHVHTVRGIDLSGYDVYVTYKQSRSELTIPAQTVTYNGTYKVEVYLLNPAGGVSIFG